jgi:heme-degrading monooxygenase HmoA
MRFGWIGMLGEGDPVVAMIRLKLKAQHSAEIVDDVLQLLKAEAAGMPGFIAGEILVSADGTAVMLLTEWTNRHAWSHSRYDVRVGKMLEHCMHESQRAEYEVYVRRGKVASETDLKSLA